MIRNGRNVLMDLCLTAAVGFPARDNATTTEITHLFTRRRRFTTIYLLLLQTFER